MVWYLSHSTAWVLNVRLLCTIAVLHTVKLGGSACASRMAECVCVCVCLATSSTFHRIYTTCTNHYSPSPLIQISTAPAVQSHNCKGKGTVHPQQATKAQKRSRVSALIFLTSAQDGGWMVNNMPWPLDPRERYPVPTIVEKAGWAPGPVWKSAENLAPIGIPSPDRPARSQSPYRLRYPGLSPTTVPFYV